MAKAKNPGTKTNPKGEECWVRYNNQGSRYVICGERNSKKFPKKGPDAHVTKPITTAEFSKKLGKGYADMTEGQKREYHALHMRLTRWNERLAQKEGEKFITKYREAKQQERLKIKELKEELQEKKEAKQKVVKSKQVVKKETFSIPSFIMKNKEDFPNVYKQLQSLKETKNPETFKLKIKGLSIGIKNDINKMKDFKYRTTRADSKNIIMDLVGDDKGLKEIIQKHYDDRSKKLKKIVIKKDPN